MAVILTSYSGMTCRCHWSALWLSMGLGTKQGPSYRLLRVTEFILFATRSCSRTLSNSWLKTGLYTGLGQPVPVQSRAEYSFHFLRHFPAETCLVSDCLVSDCRKVLPSRLDRAVCCRSLLGASFTSWRCIKSWLGLHFGVMAHVWWQRRQRLCICDSCFDWVISVTHSMQHMEAVVGDNAIDNTLCVAGSPPLWYSNKGNGEIFVGWDALSSKVTLPSKA